MVELTGLLSNPESAAFLAELGERGLDENRTSRD
jgi:hypothetical protein